MRQEWDAIVVGAGIIGLAIGRELSRRGARVAVVEKRTANSGATQASAGVLAPYIEAAGHTALLEMTVRSLHLYSRFVGDLEEETGATIEYARRGTLEVALTPAEVTRLQTVAGLLAGAGVSAQWVDGAEASRLEPAIVEPLGGLFIGTHGYVRVAQLSEALGAALHAQGGALLEHRKVEHVSLQSAEPIGLTIGGEAHRAAAVVIAAGSWSGQVMPDGPSITPVRGQLLQLQWRGPAISRVLWSDLCYVVPWADGSVLVGATVEDAGFDQRTTVAGIRSLMEAACRLLPSAGEATLEGARAGLRPGTADGLPFIGRSSAHPALFYATGHYRNGVLLAPLTAQLVADLVLEDRSDPILAAASPDR